MDILKTVITIIFVIDCIALRREKLPDSERSAERQTHIGDTIRGVPWREHL